MLPTHTIKPHDTMKDDGLYVKTTKVCRKCQVKKLAEDFNVLEGTKDGLQAWCRACMLKYSEEYRKLNLIIVRKYPELRIRGVGPYTKEALRNIAQNKGIDFDVFIKAELANIIQNYQERMRQPKPKY